MPDILLLETATRVCSVVLWSNGKVKSIRESLVENSHSSLITTFISEVLAEADLTFEDINAIAVSKGPGSYTGLRIGVSTAKGLCYALGIPLISVGTLKSMAAEFVAKNSLLPSGSLLCPMIDARRMEVYTALYDLNLNPVQAVSAKIIDELSFGNELAKSKIYFFGDGAAKCFPMIGARENTIFIEKFQVSAHGMGAIAQHKYDHSEFENVAYFEPFYLKDFVATVPKNKVIP